jgi:hypothetical protein
MTLFWLFFVLVVLVGVGTSIYRFSVARKSGIDPIAGDIQVMGKVANAAALAPEQPARSLQERLAEVDALHAAGTISDAERDAARARILGTV